MQPLLAPFSASISELKKNPILNHNSPTAYLVPADVYQQLLEKLEDYELGKLVTERQTEKLLAIEVTLDDL
jgi:antitoxin StbD